MVELAADIDQKLDQSLVFAYCAVTWLKHAEAAGFQQLDEPS